MRRHASVVSLHFRFETALLINSVNPFRRSKQQDLFNAMGSMYAAVLFVGFQNSTSIQPIVAIERTVFYRERAAGMYSALPYAFGQVISLNFSFSDSNFPLEDCGKA